MCDQISALLLAPTKIAVENLRHEGISAEQIELVGDVMYDAALFYSDRARENEIVDRFDLPPALGLPYVRGER